MAVQTIGKYRLIAELGQGGMADVLLAVTEGTIGLNFNKLVVLKKMREHLAHDPEFVAMFTDEARLAARLNHPNVVQTLEVGAAGGELFLAMEYLDGQPLHRILARARSTFPMAMQYTVLCEVLAGIHYAHELTDFDGSPLKVVHRDVTPHNVFVTYDGQVKVVDFGIAKAAGRAAETRHGILKGKIAYMSPEQARGAMVDRRTDVFAVGVMLFETAVGERLWKGFRETEILRQLIRRTAPWSPRERKPDVDPEIDAICRRAMAPSADDRYATAADMQLELEDYVERKLGRPSARQIGAWVTKEFDDKRKAMRKILESQLRDLNSASSGSFQMLKLEASVSGPVEASASPQVVPVTPAAASSRPLPVADAQPPQVEPAPLVARSSRERKEPSESSIPDDAPTRAAPPASTFSRSDIFVDIETGRRKEPRLLRYVLVAVVSLLVIVLSFVWRGAGRSSDAQGAAAASPEASDITLTLRAIPLESTFQVDNGPAFENPYLGKYKKDGKQHTVIASAPGYVAKTQMVTFSEDQSIRFALTKADAGTAPR